jgi:hypothetical protein
MSYNAGESNRKVESKGKKTLSLLPQGSLRRLRSDPTAIYAPTPAADASALALALRIDISTSLQYLSLSGRRCANLACSGSEDGGSAHAISTWLSVQRVST